MKANVLFVSLPSITYSSLESYFSDEDPMSVQLQQESLGILYLSSYLKKYGNANKIALVDYALNLLDLRNYNSIEEYILKLPDENLDFVPDILAYSINFTPSHTFLLKASTLLKRKWPNSTSIVGGFHANNATPELLAHKDIDYVFRGEGEVSFTKFVDSYNKNDLKDLDLKGLYNKEKAKGLISPVMKIQSKKTANETRNPLELELGETPEDLDSLPFPDRTIVDTNRYARQEGMTTVLDKDKTYRKASIILSRGCYFQCSFCASRTIFPIAMRFRSTKNVIQEMKDLYRDHKINFFVIEDDLFTGNKKKCITFLKEIKKLNIPDLEIQFPNDLNINTTNEEIFDAMIGAGLKVAHLSVESGSEYVQRTVINKFTRLEKVKPHVKYLQSKGILVKLIYILGFPGETPEMMQETIDFARDAGADWSLFNIATPLLGTPMYDQFIERGYIKRDVNKLASGEYKIRLFDTKEISAEDLNNLRYAANLDINFINNRNMRDGNYEFAMKLYNDVLVKYPFHIVALGCVEKCYRNLNQTEKAQEISKKIINLLQSDESAISMFKNFNHLMPELDKYKEYLNKEIQLPELALLDFDYSADDEEPETLDDAFYRATVKR